MVQKSKKEKRKPVGLGPKSVKRKPVKPKQTSSASSMRTKKVKGPKKKVKKKPKGPSWGPKPPHPTGTKKWPPKKGKKWPPKRKPPKKKKTPPATDLLQASDFTPQLFDSFRVLDFDPVIEIQLIDVTSFGTQTIPDGVEDEVDELRTEPFSLTFRGPPGADFTQDVYTLEHDEMGTLLMLLVPLGYFGEGDEEQEAVLEAVFN
jgi:hypothetical protein